MLIAIPTLGADGGKSGISQYLIHLIREFSLVAPHHSFRILSPQVEAPLFVPPGSRNVTLQVVPDRVRSPLPSLVWTFARLPRVLRELQADVVFMPAGNRRLAMAYPCPSVGAVHDYSSLHVAGKYDRARLFYIRQVLPRLARRLTHVLTISESSRRDIVEYAGIPPDRVTVTPLACDTEQYYPVAPEVGRGDAVAERYGLDVPFFIYVSRIEHPGKNHVALIEAFNRFRSAGGDRRLLVLAGSDWSGAGQVHAVAARSPFAADIRFLGFVPQSDIPDLYRAARALVFPSLYEGFGLPVLEGMACGTPVACSNRSSLPEVAGDAGLLFDPTDAGAIAETLKAIDENDELRCTLSKGGIARAATFSWRRTAEMTLEVIEAVVRKGSQ